MDGLGYVKLWRQAERSAVWDAGDGVWRLWCCLLLRTSHKSRKAILRIGAHAMVVELEAGQYAVRLRLLAADLRISVNTLRRRLQTLVDLECITMEPSAKCTLVTVINWEKYQAEGVSTIDTPSDTPSDTHHKKTKKTKKVRSKRGTAFRPPSVDQVKVHVETAGLSATDPEDFWSYYQARGWKLAKGAAMKDWKAAASQWNARQKRWDAERGGPRPGGNGAPASNQPTPDQAAIRDLFKKGE